MKITRSPITAAGVLAIISLSSVHVVHAEAFPHDEVFSGQTSVEYAQDPAADYALAYDGAGAGGTIYDNAGYVTEALADNGAGMDSVVYDNAGYVAETPMDGSVIHDNGGYADYTGQVGNGQVGGVYEQYTGQADLPARNDGTGAYPVEVAPVRTQGGAVYYDVAGSWQGGQESTVQTSALPVPQPAPASYSAVELGERLLAAVRAGNANDIRWLLRKGADPEYKPHANALSALDLVVQGGWVDVAEVFYQEGVNFNRQGNQGITFLHQAAAAGKLPMVRFLVKAGLNPNGRTSKDWTPLHHAARFGHADVVDFLLQAGADPAQRNSDGLRARELAINAHHLQIARMF
ncbi:MAG TPA: ankyrin repeat domain-containing protein [Thiolinea sp.]|nr:ankyrin repeat domain-containing protein [Thiolinea sp.]